MTIKKGNITIRSHDFRKYYTTHYSTHHTKRTVHLDVGNENTILPDGKKANVSECQLMMDFYGLKALTELLNFELKQVEKKYGTIKEED